MNLHEYQAKALLREFGVKVPQGIMIESAADAERAAREIATDTWAVKAQIHAGGRGKAGGVKIAKSPEEVANLASHMLGMTLVTHQTGPAGKRVRKLLIEQGIYYPGPSPVKEFYLSILLNRNTGRYEVIYSTEGGMDIESVAEATPERIFRESVDPKVGLMPFQARKIAFNLGLEWQAMQEMTVFVQRLYAAFMGLDASLLEINPVLKSSDDHIWAADVKLIIDDNALYRHPDVAKLRDIYEEDPAETEATAYNLNFIKLNGNVGCMVNGAGLAMATMDMIKLSGGEPANFLDVGGAANAQTVEAGFKIILKDPQVKAILINIFGGIVRCDRVAQGVVEAYKNLGHVSVPIIVRLQGTNAQEGKKLIDESGLQVYGATTIEEAAQLVQKVLAG